MEAQPILVPIYRGTLVAKIESGTYWSVIEHLILFGLAQAPRTLTELATYSNIHPSVATEAVTRLLRVGWAELTESSGVVRFRASKHGTEEAKKDELTPITSTVSRKLHYVIDRSTGDLFGINGLSLSRARDSMGHPPNVRSLPTLLNEDDLPGYLEVMQRLDVLPEMLRPNEKITGCDTEQSHLSPGWNLSVIASESEVRGLSKSHSPRLYEYLRAASAAWGSRNSAAAGAASPTAPTRLSAFAERRTQLVPEDLITGGRMHRETFQGMIGRARQVMILHSTFLSKDKLEKRIAVLARAAKRQVKIHILWDCGYGPDDTRTLESCRHLINVSGLRGWRLYAIPTHSHAKMLVADDGTGDMKRSSVPAIGSRLPSIHLKCPFG
jgi:cardiolipin synthase A/B